MRYFTARYWRSLTVAAAIVAPVLGSAETAQSSDEACPILTAATFTAAVEDRQPVSELTQAPVSLEELLFYTAVTDGKGSELHHRWSYNNELVADVSLSIGSDFWRTWSSKSFANLAVEAGGQWQVAVTTESGCQLGQWTLDLVDADSAGEPVASQTTTVEVTAVAPPSPPKRHNDSPVDLQENYTAIEELLELGDTSGARRAIKLARERTNNPDQLAELEALENDNEAFAQLSKLIRQRDIAGARQLLDQLMISVSENSPVYPALKSRRQLLEQLGGTAEGSEGFQAAATNG